jgi:GxxExxY protein
LNKNEIRGAVDDGAMKIHSALGPGLLESAYAACLKHELIKRGLRVSCEVPLPVVHDGVRLEAGYRLDMVVEDPVVVELKAIEALAPIHQAQIISYLKLSGKPIGLLINFHSLHLKDGLNRFVV